MAFQPGLQRLQPRSLVTGQVALGLCQTQLQLVQALSILLQAPSRMLEPFTQPQQLLFALLELLLNQLCQPALYPSQAG